MTQKKACSVFESFRYEAVSNWTQSISQRPSWKWGETPVTPICTRGSSLGNERYFSHFQELPGLRLALDWSPLWSESRTLEAQRVGMKQTQWRTTTQWNTVGCQGLWKHIWTDVDTPSCHIQLKSLCFGYCRFVPLNMTIYIYIYIFIIFRLFLKYILVLVCAK